ncbi:MAG: hypothetical protein H6737_29390 [Alphaproteobacteria bacterium]|nr:hypothetical protein [Alphaproteobacteria bacterium]
MSDLDSLLARSKDPGSFVERRQFTLSREKALEKMRQFTLRHPGQYALEVVQAAVFMEARWMFVDATDEAVTLGWIGGKAISRAEMDGLFDYLFVSEANAETRHLRQIAIAVNVLLQRKPELMRIESGDINGAARLDLNPDGTGTVGVPAEGLEGTYVHVRFGSTGWLGMFRRARIPPAAELIETECMFSPTSIFVNGNGPLGWDPHMPLRSLHLSKQKTFRGGGRDGWIGKGRSTDRNLVTLVIGGVRIAQREIPEFGANVQGVIRDDSLVKTADMSDVVDDIHWQRMLHALQPIAQALQGEHYVLPELDPLPSEDDFDSDDPADVYEPPPLAEGVRVLGRSALVETGTLVGLPEGVALYWIVPADLPALEQRLDPLRFPERVLVVTPDQAQALAGEAPHLSLHRIEAADADFVVTQRMKARSVRRYQVNLSESTVHLQLHEDGRPPGWSRGEGVPLLVASQGRTRGFFAIGLTAPHVSVVIETDAYEHDDRWAVARKATQVAKKHVWRLLPEDPAAFGLTHRELCVALLAEGLEVLPHPDGHSEARLPDVWAEEAQRLLDLPLVESGVTGRRLLDAMGSHVAVPVGAVDEIAALAPLTERLGVGHLTHGSLAGAALIELRWDGGGWRAADTPDPGESVRAILRIAPTFAPVAPEGWVVEDSPHPILLAARRPHAEDVPWDDGWRRLAVAVRMTASAEIQTFSGVALQRDDLLRLAGLALHPRVPARDLAATDGRQVPVAHVLSGAARVAYRAGPELVDETVLVTADEAEVLAGLAPSGRLKWRFDDAPSVWARRPEGEGDWLATVDVVGDMGRGWLGLRHPYDPTGSVFLRRGWRTHIASDLDRYIRCHGFVHTRGEHAHDALDDLHAAAFELLLKLAQLLEAGGLDDARLASAIRYAADFAWLGKEAGNPIPPALADRLAQAVPITRPDGASWGTMRLWLVSAPSVRPPFPFPLHGHHGAPVEPDAASSVPVTIASEESEGPSVEAVIHHAVQRMAVGLEVHVTTFGDSHRIEAWGVEQLHVVLGLRDVLVRAALAGDKRALARVLLRVARVVHASEARQHTDRDFLSMQKAALASLDLLP